MKLGRILDWFYVGALGFMVVFALIAGVFWVAEAIPPVRFTASQVFGFTLILASWIILQVLRLPFQKEAEE